MAELTGVASTAQDVASVGHRSPNARTDGKHDHVIHVLRRADGELSDEGHVSVIVHDHRTPNPGAEDLTQRDASDIHEPSREHPAAITVEPLPYPLLEDI